MDSPASWSASAPVAAAAPTAAAVSSGPAKVTGKVVTVGQEVHTTYGTGKIIEIRKDDMLVIRPTMWNLANGCVPTFFIKATPPPHTPGASLEPLPRIPYVDGPVSEPEVWEKKAEALAAAPEVASTSCEMSTSVLEMLDVESTSSSPEVWEKKAENLASKPEIIVSGGVTINRAATRASVLMGSPSTDPKGLSEEEKKKVRSLTSLVSNYV